MLAAFTSLPLAVRSAIIAVLAVAAARFVNWAIYSWAWNSRQLGPWSKPGPMSNPGESAANASVGSGAKSANSIGRRLSDHIPAVGWFLLRREATQHGRGYWIRPLLIEILFPVFIVWYYCMLIGGGTLPLTHKAGLPGAIGQLHWQFLAHFLLFTLMTIATFIDFDEQSIPDYVTVSGTVIGLLGATFAPAWLPFHAAATPAGAPVLQELHAMVPIAWPLWFNDASGLQLGLLILAVWGFALLDRRWVGRRGFAKGVQYFFARMFRVKALWLSLLGVTAGLMLLAWIGWTTQNGLQGRWQYLLSSLFGLAFAGGVTWGVRVSASMGLGVEALGFGDVTLMAMIGTYVGWQPSLLIFFIAPVIAIAFVLLRAIITGDTATPYGPYLCAATAIVLIWWDALWNQWAARVFTLGPIILGIVVACVALMGAMLWIWRLIKEALGFGHR